MVNRSWSEGFCRTSNNGDHCAEEVGIAAKPPALQRHGAFAIPSSYPAALLGLKEPSGFIFWFLCCNDSRGIAWWSLNLICLLCDDPTNSYGILGLRLLVPHLDRLQLAAESSGQRHGATFYQLANFVAKLLQRSTGALRIRVASNFREKLKNGAINLDNAGQAFATWCF